MYIFIYIEDPFRISTISLCKFRVSFLTSSSAARVNFWRFQKKKSYKHITLIHQFSFKPINWINLILKYFILVPIESVRLILAEIVDVDANCPMWCNRY